jgi:uncharacterized protein YkwD
MSKFFLIALVLFTSCKLDAFPFPIPRPRPQEPIPAPPTRDPGIPDLEPDLKQLINQARVDRGLPILVTVSPLDCAAAMHARDMYDHNMCSHRGSNGDLFWERAKLCNGVASGEIIACGHKTAEAAVRDWLADKPHYDIIMDSKNVAMGAKRVGDYWVVIFRK